MPLSVGDQLGPYEILALVGKGGMGEVYRAHDTRLHRDVAIKVSDAQFSERFTREARAIAALNHTNICHLYDVVVSKDAPNYLVLEYVEGPDLRGPLDFDEALPIIQQLIDGIEAAHEKNIIHRDLKPANIKITPEGVVKILDFGLAKQDRDRDASGTGSASSDPENSPTLTMGATAVGTILGTAAYMAPEQARGKAVDKRADIWAFGVVLFEMLTGKRLFKGEDASVTLAAVIKEEPDFNLVPASLRPLLQMCLRKDPAKRLPDIAAAKLMLEQVQESGSQPVQVVPESKGGSRKMIWAAAAMLVLAVAAGAAWVLKPKPEQPLFQMEINPPEGVKFTSPLTPFALSPDGHKLVFVAAGKDGKRMLWLRSIDSETAAALSGTEGAEVPFWSPDSRWVGFSANGKLQKMDVTGGSQPQVICDIEGRAGGTWNQDGVILFDQGTKPIQRVSAAGGTPTSVFPLDASRGEATHLAPYFLPDGQHFLYYSTGKTLDSKFGSLDGKVNRVVLERQSVPTYAPNPRGGGWLVYNVRGQLTARPFDPVKGEFTGPSAVVASGVGQGRWWYASGNGIMAFRHNYGSQYQFSWFGCDGHPQGTVGDPGDVASPRISPDQKTVAFRRTNEQNPDIWNFDLTRNTSARVTFEPGFDVSPIWSPDSKSIVYASQRNGASFVVERPANGVGSEAILANKVGDPWFPSGESRDGHWLVFSERSPVHSVVVLRSREDPNKLVRIQGRENELDGSISPDGRWLLYSSAPASRREIIVQSMPQEAGGGASGAGKWQISTEGGSQPAWRADGKEIFYIAPDGMMMAVPVESGEGLFRPGAPKPLFQTRLQLIEQGQATDIAGRQYDVTADGQRFLFNQHVADATDAPITVVVNWPKLLEKH